MAGLVRSDTPGLMTSPRVLVLTPFFPVEPGAKDGNFVLDQVTEFAAAGASVSVVVGKAWVPPLVGDSLGSLKASVNADAYRDSGFEVQTVRYFSMPRYLLGTFAAPLMSLGMLPRLRSIVRERRIEIIHAHGIGAAHVARALADEFRLPFIVTLHGIDQSPRFANTQAKRKQIGRSLERADRVVFVGSPLLGYYGEFVATTSNFTVIPNGFRVFDGLAPSTRIPRRGFRIVTAGNFEASKGFDLLIRATAALRSSGARDVELVIVGDGLERQALVSLAGELGLADSVHFTGYLSHPETEAEILAGDVFCLPAWREAFGVVYLEAMALGRPTIGCRGQGPSDFISHGETGFLVEPRSVESLVEVLSEVLADPVRTRKIAETGSSKAFQQLTWQHNAARILKLCRELIAGHAANAAKVESQTAES